MEYYNISLHDFLWIVFSFFFQNGLCRFFYILSWLRILLRSFFLNTVDCYNVSPHSFYFAMVLSHMFFFQNYLYRICFLILSWLKIQLLTFPTCFFYLFLLFFPKLYSYFFFFFFCIFFSELFLLIFFNMELVENLAL